MKIAFTADCHLGIKSHSTNRIGIPSRTLDAIRGVDQIRQEAVRFGVDVFIVGGDLFHRPHPRPMIIKAALELLDEIEQDFSLTMVLAGNHDPKPVDGIGVIGLLERSFANRSIKFFEEDADFDHEEITFSVRPYTKKVGQLRPAPPGTKSVMLAHHHFVGAAVGSENTMMAGGVPITDSAGDADLILSGHIHKPQEITVAGKSVFYPGSPARFDFGDRNDVKGFWLIDTAAGFKTDFVPIKTRDMVQIRMDAAMLSVWEDETILAALKRDGVQGADVKVVLKCDDVLQADTVRLAELILRAGAHYLAPIEIELQRQQRAREKEINRESNKEKCVKLWAQRNDLGSFTEQEVVDQALQVMDADSGY